MKAFSWLLGFAIALLSFAIALVPEACIKRVHYKVTREVDVEEGKNKLPEGYCMCPCPVPPAPDAKPKKAPAK